MSDMSTVSGMTMNQATGVVYFIVTRYRGDYDVI